jgi:outer membrane protein OmpA-like peptidoglycan-associated protein
MVAHALRELLGRSAPPIIVRGFGEARPVAPNIHPNGSDDPTGRRLNRRVEIELIVGG